MPYNEFILYRCKHYPHEKQIVLLTGYDILIPKERIPKSIEIHIVGKNPLKLRKELKRIITALENNEIHWLIHLHSIRGAFSMLIGMIGLGYRRHTIYSIHSTYTGYRFYNKILCAYDVLASNFTTCVSKVSYSKLPSWIKSIKGKNIMPLQNGVNTERIDDAETLKEHPILPPIIKFVYVARMVALKNHRFLIDVLSQVPNKDNIKFVFIGAEDKNGKIREYAKEKGVIDNIEFSGLIQREKVYSLLPTYDVYISSSTLEGLPVSVLEGMYCGLPAVLSDIPQHKEVSNGCESVRILPYDTHLWAETITELSNTDQTKLRAMGEACKMHIRKHFSLSHMHQQYDELYAQIRKA
ncbi:MAG: glycosyltransferase family 4 protein [Prevotella sp.]|nr:glycosyltransferase family 4 protein [Prevotella sp.]